MDLSSIVYAMIGGALGGGIGALFSKKFKGTLGTVLMAVSVVGFWQVTTGMYKAMILPRILPLNVEEVIEEFPLLGHIRQNSPEKFKEMIVPFDRVMRNGGKTEKGISEFRNLLNAELEERQQTASAETLREEAKVAIRLYKALRDPAPEVCTQKLHGRSYGDISSYLNEDYVSAEQKALSLYYTNLPRAAGYVADLENGKAIFDPIVQAVVKQFEITNLDPVVSGDEQNDADHQKICDFHIEVNSGLLELSDKDTLDAWSYLKSQ